MKFYCNIENFTADIAEVIRAFTPRALEEEGGGELFLQILQHKDNSAVITLTFQGEKGRQTSEKTLGSAEFSDPLEQTRRVKRAAKVLVYDFMSAHCGATLPYGSLTGVRPTKLFHDLTAKGEDAFALFTRDLRVSEDKAKLIQSVCRAQQGLKRERNDSADIFVNIPFCTTRCSYCSFISAEIGRVKRFIPAYVELLVKEIEAAREIIRERGFTLRAVYVGGGTPTSLPDEDFARVLGALKGFNAEFTVEAGRPDTICASKLDIMDKTGVTRISVNPQSLNDKTIALIGRKHTATDFFRAYDLARKYPFDINCDLIAGLPGEDEEDFARSADGVFRLLPDNVTVHTLALKKGSGLKLAGFDNSSGATAGMVDYARALAEGQGYIPYYMYRQKYMSGNLENAGYCLPGKQCLYNIDVMEECANIIACGAGGISKLYLPEQNRLERLADPKGLDVYLERGERLIAAKRAFFGL